MQLLRMSLLRLPNEILLFIAETLTSERDINALTRTNRRFHNLLNTYLYRYNIRWGGSSALLWAAEHGMEATVRKLLDEGADVQATPNPTQNRHPRKGDPPNAWFRTRTPLELAASSGHEAVAKLLLGRADVHLKPYYRTGRWMPLWLAARHGHAGVVKLLLTKEGIDPGRKDMAGQTPLSVAAWYGHENVVRVLLAENVDPDPVDDIGFTPLWRASRNGHEMVVKLLIAQENVNLCFKDWWCGKTALDIAIERGHKKVSRLLSAAIDKRRASYNSAGSTLSGWRGSPHMRRLIRFICRRK